MWSEAILSALERKILHHSNNMGLYPFSDNKILSALHSDLKCIWLHMSVIRGGFKRTLVWSVLILLRTIVSPQGISTAQTYRPGSGKYLILTIWRCLGSRISGISTMGTAWSEIIPRAQSSVQLSDCTMCSKFTSIVDSLIWNFLSWNGLIKGQWRLSSQPNLSSNQRHKTLNERLTSTILFCWLLAEPKLISKKENKKLN